MDGGDYIYIFRNIREKQRGRERKRDKITIKEKKIYI